MSSLKPNQLKAPSRITRSATKAAKSSAVNADVLSPSAASPPKSKLSKLTQTTSEAITAQSEVGSVRRGEPDLKMADRSVMQTKEENARIKDLEQSLILEKTRAETLQRQLSDTKVAIASEKSHVADLEEKLAMNNDEVEELRQELMESIRENARIKELEISLILEKTKAETLQRQLSDTKVAIASEKSHVAKLEEELATNNDEVEELRQELSLVCQSKKDGPRRKYQNVESAAQILAADKEKLKAELHDAKRELRRMNLFFDMFQISDGETVSEVFGNIDEQMSQESLHAVDVELQNPHQEMQVLSRSEEYKAAQDINYEKQELEKKYQNLNSAAQILAADKEKLKAELHDANKELRRMNLFIDMFQISDGETVSEVFGNIDEQMSQESLHAVDVELQNPHQEMQVLSRSEEHKAAQKINYEKQELEKKYQNLNSAAQILAADKEKLKAVLHEMKSQLDKLVQKNLELENSRDELIQARIVMEKETHLLEKHYNKIIDEQICIISEKKPVSQRLTQSKVDMARKQSALYREHKMTLARAQELENKVSVLLIEQENLVRAVEALTSERDELASERDELASERDELASERDELASEREELASEREELASEREELASEREELASERDELASKVKDLHQENQKILVNYAELTVEMAVVTNQLYYSEKQNEELQLTSERIRMLHTEIMMKIKKKAIKLKHVFKMLSKAQQ